MLRRLALQHNRWIDALCRHVGISRSDYDALEALDEHGSLTPSEWGSSKADAELLDCHGERGPTDAYLRAARGG